MIINVPSADELTSVSLRLYFKAWAEVTSILEDWSRHFDMRRSRSFGGGRPEKFEPDDDWRAYLENAQNDLQGIYTLVQQSQEIGIKARICEVSPYLLLKGLQAKPVAEGSVDYDFTDFQTIDAAELVRVHNMVCDHRISPVFRELVEDIRRNRNKIHHLGILNRSLDPHAVIDVLQLQYSELYPRRRWMADRIKFGSVHRWSDWMESDFNATTGAMLELHDLEPMLTPNQFKRLTGHGPSKRRYICHYCVREANFQETSVAPSLAPTAFRLKGEMKIRCVLCDETEELIAERCTGDNCRCVFTTVDPNGERRCVGCGYTAGEIADAIEQRRQMDEYRASGRHDPFDILF